MAGSRPSTSAAAVSLPPPVWGLLTSVLPVREFPALLRELAGCWREVTEARGCIIALAEPLESAPTPAAAIALVDELPRMLDSSALSPSGDEPADLSAILRDSLSPEDAATLPFEEHVLVCDTRMLGRVCLAEAQPSRQRPEVLSALADLSARLIEQCEQTHSSSSTSSPRRQEPRTDVVPLDAAKLEALAEFAAGAGHEINNPLATIAGRAQMLLAGESDPDRRQALQTIGGQAYRIRDMIGDVMLFARPPEPKPARTDLAALVREVTSRFEGEISRRRIHLTLALSDATPVEVDPTQLSVALASLIQNSLNAVADGGHLEIRLDRVIEEGKREMLRLEVEDDGPGFTPEVQEHLFDPFYSGRQAGRGLGFGLSKCWRIVTLHRGQLQVTRSAAGRTCFTILLPSSHATYQAT